MSWLGAVVTAGTTAYQLYDQAQNDGPGPNGVYSYPYPFLSAAQKAAQSNSLSAAIANGEAQATASLTQANAAYETSQSLTTFLKLVGGAAFGWVAYLFLKRKHLL